MRRGITILRLCNSSRFTRAMKSMSEEVLPKNGNEKSKQKSAELKKMEKEEKKRKKLEKFQKKQNNQKTFEVKAKPTTFQAEEIVVYESDRPLGEKKDTLIPLPSKYHPRFVEARWYDWWVKCGYFKPEYQNTQTEKPAFTMIIPPPNVTGTLHIGHALMCSVQDAFVRWNRMHGRKVLWNPGCDHAGIATQVVVEKKIKNERNLTRHDIGRDAFMEEVWKWKEEKGVAIYDQMKRLGISVDWDRDFFTMDTTRSKAVVEAFVRLYDQGLVYRDKRLVNWSCALKSAISDIEVDMVEINGRKMMAVPGYTEKIEFGVIINFSYPIEGSEERITVATTRIETMLGDVAVAVHPEDDRYQHLIGKQIQHPFCNRVLTIIGDVQVDRHFGTGAVKITPAHDPNDYEMGRKHDLKFINIFTDDGFVVENLDYKQEYKFFAGMKRFNARVSVLQHLKKLGLFVKKLDHNYSIPVCNRSKDVIEPLVKSQWYIKCAGMADQAFKEVATGKLHILPPSHVKTWNRWLENIKDWCVSRQLWWGHRVPAYFITSPLLPESDRDISKFWVCARNEEEAIQRATDRFQLPRHQIVLVPDEDVLDTWFSSGLLPISTFGWPDCSEDFSTFYPTTLLETGYDILFFWVARMVMLSLQLTEKIPFKAVLLHSIVRDAQGRKMSKSLGNIIDPVDVVEGISLAHLHQKLEKYNLDSSEVEIARTGQSKNFPSGIPECGTDALRFALCEYSTSSKDINMDILKVQSYRFFCNKIWNAYRYCMSNVTGLYTPEITDLENYSKINKWILSRLANTQKLVDEAFTKYDLSSATSALYNFWLYEFCDIFLEWTKTVFGIKCNVETPPTQQVLFTVVHDALLLLHPFMPYLSEELYQRLPFDESQSKRAPSICVAAYPNILDYVNTDVDKHVTSVMSLVNAIRSTKDDYVSVRTKTQVFVVCHSSDALMHFTAFHPLILNLSCSSSVSYMRSNENIPPGCAVRSHGNMCDIYVYLNDQIDVSKEIFKTEQKINMVNENISKLEGYMNMPDYSTKVPPNIQTNYKTKLNSYLDELDKLNEMLRCLKAVG